MRMPQPPIKVMIGPDEGDWSLPAYIWTDECADRVPLEVPEGWHVVQCVMDTPIAVHDAEPGVNAIGIDWGQPYTFPFVVMALPCKSAHRMERWHPRRVNAWMQMVFDAVHCAGSA